MSKYAGLLGGLPPICRDANRLLLAVEQCARSFPRNHKYQVGADLRHQAMQVARLARRAQRDQPQEAKHVAPPGVGGGRDQADAAVGRSKRFRRF